MPTLATLSSYQYAAGSWALQLTGQVSPLSTLTDRVVLKRSWFHLRLWESADTPDRIQADGQPTFPAETSPADGSRQPPPAFEVSGHGSDLANLSHLVQTYVQHYLQVQGLTPSQGLSQGQNRLAPVGLTRHRLTVTGTSSPAAVNLSLVQLADLATVLGQAEQAVAHWSEELAPAQRRPSRLRWPARLPLWTGSVAAVLVAAVLGSQWLGSSPPALVLPPRPTAETSAPENAAGGTAEENGAITEGSPPFDSDPLEAEPLAEADSSNGSFNNDEPQGLQPRSGLQNPQNLPATQGRGDAPALAPVPRASDRSPTPNPPSNAPRPDVASTEPDRAVAPDPQPRPDSLAAVPSQAAPPSPTTESPSTSSSPVPPPEAIGSQSRVSTAASSAPPPASPGSPETQSSESAAELAPAPSAGLADSAPVHNLDSLRVALAEFWSPIPGLASPLRYRLTLGPAGEILAIEPLTAPSRQYLTQTPLPPVGTVLPNLSLPEPTTVEIELLPSGDVQVHPTP